MPKNHFQNLGIGLGLRIPHYRHIFTEKPKVDFFEIISENFMVDGGPPLHNLKKILDHYPVVQHGVSLSIASAEELDFNYLKRLKKLAQMTKTPWFSDHLCWSRSHGHNFHDLLPVPYTEENARYIAQKARQVQDYMGLPFAIENLSTYIAFENSEMSEWEFYRMVVEEAGCYMMLDINNIFVSSVNHHFDPWEYISNIPWEKVIQVHLAGPSELPDGTMLDTHDTPVRPEVWALYEEVCKKTDGISTLMEWDDNIPDFQIVHDEALKARQYQLKHMPNKKVPSSLKLHQEGFGQSISTPLIIHNDGYERQEGNYQTELIQNVKATAEKSSSERVASYNEQYWFRLITVMQDEYPLLCELVGVTDFNRLVSDYLTACPSENPSLNFLSDRFLKFLQQTPWNDADYQQCAHLEHILIQLFDRKEEVFNFIQIASTETGDQLNFHEAWFLFKEDWNLLESRNRIKADPDAKVSLIEQTRYWCLRRLHNHFYEDEISEVQFILLGLLKGGMSIEDACLKLESILSEEQLAEVESNIQQWFHQWSSEGWFS